MKSPNISPRAARGLAPSSSKKGFTLVEVLIVIGLLAALFSLGVFFSFDIWRGTSFRSERDVVVSLLQKARSRSMANINQSAWGLCIMGNSYVLYPGSTCSAASPESMVLSASASATSTGLALGIVFSQLSGTTTGGMVVVKQDTRVATITISYEGTIDW